jgi:hypothetical protein
MGSSGAVAGSPTMGSSGAGSSSGPDASSGSIASSGTDADASAPSGDDASAANSSSGDAPAASGASSSGAPGGGTIDSGDLVGRLLALTAACSGSKVVSKHPYQLEGGNRGTANICKLNGALYYTSGMNIDCDGRTTPNCPGTGANKDCCYQNDTAFHNQQGQPLAAELDPYVVIPNDFMYPGLDTTNGGNVIAVIYKNQIEYAVFGDTGPSNIIGEASFLTAKNLGIDSSPATGGTPGPVTYIVFVGPGTQPSDIENQNETQSLGAALTQQLLANN